MRLGKTFHLGEAYKMKLTRELFELLVEDCLKVSGWAGMRKHLDQPFYSGRLRIPEGGVFISLAEMNRRRKRRREEELQDFEDTRQLMKKRSQRKPRD